MENQYFVVQPVLIVAQDLAHAIRAYDASAQVHIFGQVSDALSALSDTRPLAVFLHSRLNGVQSQRIKDALRDAGVPFAFTGAEAEVFPVDAHVLASPFTEATVATLLQELVGRVPETEDEV